MENPLRINITKASDSIEIVRNLRYSVLREPLGMSFDSTLFQGDLLPGTIHLIAEFDSNPVGCLTLLSAPLEIPAAFPESVGEGAEHRATVFKPGADFDPQNIMQLRGMAVLSSHQRHGIGRKLVAEADRIALSLRRRLWCKARRAAVPFYERNGWKTVGEYFEIPIIGPHVIMWR